MQIKSKTETRRKNFSYFPLTAFIEKASRRDAQPAPARSCSKGFGGATTNKQNERPARGGTFIFCTMGPSCIACYNGEGPESAEISALGGGPYLSYNGRVTGLTLHCLSCYARRGKLSAGPLIAAFDLRRLKHWSRSNIFVSHSKLNR